MSLPLPVPDAVPDAMADRLEHHVRRLGIPLPVAEDVLVSLDEAEAFLAACEAGRGRAYADELQGREPRDDEDPTVTVKVTTDPPSSTRHPTGSARSRQA